MMDSDDNVQRSRWNSTRNKSRNRARYLIRERISHEKTFHNNTAAIEFIQQQNDDYYPLVEEEEHYDNNNNNCNNNNNSNDSKSNSKQDDVSNVEIEAQDESKDKVSHFLQAIASGSASTFSLNVLAHHHDILTRPIPTSMLSQYKIQTLCTSRFGPTYTQAMFTYTSAIHNITIIEYATLLGEYGVVKNLLAGGITPLHISSSTFTTEYDNMSQRIDRVKAKVIQKLLVDLMPLSLAVYLIKTISEMKMFTTAQRLNNNIYTHFGDDNYHDDEGHKDHCANTSLDSSVVCSICKNSTFISLQFQKCHSYPCTTSNSNYERCNICQDSQYCEACMWEYFIDNIDTRVDGDVARCPCFQCDSQTEQHITRTITEHNNQCKNYEIDPDIHIKRRQESLRLYNNMPLLSRELKVLPKKAKSKNTIHSTWYDAIEPVIGKSQDVRKDKFTKYINMGAIHHVRVCLQSGIDVNMVNEYNQTPLYIACWRNYKDIVMLLLHWGASLQYEANGHMTIYNVLKVNGHSEIIDDILQFDTMMVDSMNMTSPTLKERLTHSVPITTSNPHIHEMDSTPKGYVHDIPNNTSYEEAIPSVTTLIHNSSQHPGASSYYIDNILPKRTIAGLEDLWHSLPIADGNESTKIKKANKNIPCSIRYYFCDAEGYLIDELSKIVFRELKTYNNDFKSKLKRVVFFPQMRVLHYEQPGSALLPHIDLTKVNVFTGERSTHTFILYLTNCEFGGETALLKELSPSGPLGDHEVLCKVEPRRSRLLLFPHVCPHEGLRVISTPKVLLRGEVLIDMILN